MQISGLPFGTTDWSQVEAIEHQGESGLAYWRTRHFGNIWVRMVEYTPGYLAITGASKATSCYASRANSSLNSKTVENSC